MNILFRTMANEADMRAYAKKHRDLAEICDDYYSAAEEDLDPTVVPYQPLDGDEMPACFVFCNELKPRLEAKGYVATIKTGTVFFRFTDHVVIYPEASWIELEDGSVIDLALYLELNRLRDVIFPTPIVQKELIASSQEEFNSKDRPEYLYQFFYSPNPEMLKKWDEEYRPWKYSDKLRGRAN